MTDDASPPIDLRAGLIEGLIASRAAERDILAALDPTVRDTPPADGEWSPKDVQAHLSAWRAHQAERLEALRLGHAEPDLPATETDAANAIFHAARADWPWDQVAADADAANDRLIDELRQASDAVIGDDRIIATTMGNGPEHDLGHLPALAAKVGLEDRVAELADSVTDAVRSGAWPARASALRATTWPASTRCPGASTKRGRSFGWRSPSRRSCATWRPTTTTSSRSAPRSRT